MSRVKLWNNFKKKKIIIITIIKKKIKITIIRKLIIITIIKLSITKIPRIIIKLKKAIIKKLKPNPIIILIVILKRIRKLVPRFLTLFSITKIVFNIWFSKKALWINRNGFLRIGNIIFNLRIG